MLGSCVICGKSFTSKRSDKVFCSPACKQKKQRISKRAIQDAKSRTPTMGEFQDLNLVRSISAETSELMHKFWGKYGSTIGGEVLEIVWCMMVDAKLIPDNYKDIKGGW